MENNFNFVERFAPLSNLQGTVVEFDYDRFIIAPEGMISCRLQEDHVVVWYKNDGEDQPRFAQMGEFVNYRQVISALLPIDLPWGTGLNPFEIRASLKRPHGLSRKNARRLNPFEIRASLKRPIRRDTAR